MQTAVKCSIIFSRTEKNQRNVYPQTLVRFLNVTQTWFVTQRLVRFSIFHKVFRLRIVFILLKSENCLWRFSTKFRFSFPLSRKIFHLQISLIFLRKNRSEAFCVSSENILHLTFCSLAKWRKSKHKCSVLHKSSIEELPLNLALNPPFCQTAVTCCVYFIFSTYLSMSKLDIPKLYDG